jgi:hypothetical protein
VPGTAFLPHASAAFATGINENGPSQKDVTEVTIFRWRIDPQHASYEIEPGTIHKGGRGISGSHSYRGCGGSDRSGERENRNDV